MNRKLPLLPNIVKLSLLGALVVATQSAQVLAQSQSFPSQNIRIIVPFGPGNSPDQAARIVSAGLTKKYGTAAVVDNRPGASGILGAEIFKGSKPDGHTLFVGDTAVLAINKSLRTRLPYDPEKDFTPITQMIALPFYLYVSPSLKVRSVAELIALAKSKPNVLNYGSPGPGSVHQLCFALFAKLTGVQVTHIPYKTSGDLTKGLMVDEVQMMCSGKAIAGPLIAGGKAIPLVVASQTRTAFDPDVPTLKEATGIEGFDVKARIGMLAPAGTPKEIIEQLSNDIASFLQAEDVRTSFNSHGVEVVTEGTDRYAATIKSESAQYADLVKLIGVKLDY